MSDLERWCQVQHLMGEKRLRFGQHVSYWFFHSPRHALHCMSYYKFAAKMIGQGRRVLDVGCGEGLGTWLLAKECGFAMGIDFDADAIGAAKGNFQSPNVAFDCADFLSDGRDGFDAVVSLDVIEHIHRADIDAYLQNVCRALKQEGIAVIGTPSLASQQYASEIARVGHVNIYDGEGLEKELQRYFVHVFLFAAHDEVIHTGFLPLAHYLLAIGCRPRKT